ncbi:MAG: transglycosylase SLT domain-containing protein, partial [Gammaproteobacteria bacterium]|nr:transglycosylase SLT domain-containing protein [Gammaproteobacteria bacterium]
MIAASGCASLQDSSRGGSSSSGGYFSPTAASASTRTGVLAENFTRSDAKEVTSNDVWDRIRAGFSLPAGDANRVARERQRYIGLNDFWTAVSERASPYLFHITEEIDTRGLPMEVALLPIVESAYKPTAYSHGRAAGLWQFIPSTGRHFGLDQNWWYDGRRDVLASTDAALTYLTNLHELFDGDWLLAFAAYNAGQGTVARAIKRNEAAGKPTDYWSLSLPRETMQYVPRLLAARDIVLDPSAYGVALLPVNNQPALSVVELEHQFDLALAAELAGIDMEMLYALNPGYNRW